MVALTTQTLLPFEFIENLWVFLFVVFQSTKSTLEFLEWFRFLRCKSFQSPQLCWYGYFAMYYGVGLTQNAFTHRWNCWSNWPLPKWQEKHLEVKCFLTLLGNWKIQQFLRSWDSKSIKITLISGQGKLIHFTDWFVFNQFHFLFENSCWHSSDTSDLLNTH